MIGAIMVDRIYNVSKPDFDDNMPTRQKIDMVRLESVADGDTTYETRLLMPEEPVVDDVLMFAYGMGANSFFHEDEACAIAELGYPVALHDEPRRQKRMTVIDLAFGRRSLHSHMEHKLNPMIFASQAISGAMRSVEEVYNPAGGFTIKGHSKGGITAAMLGAYEPNVRAVVLDAPAGVLRRNALMNHMRDGRGMVMDEALPMARLILDSGIPGSRERATASIIADPGRLGREILSLVGRTPDIRHELTRVKKRGGKVAVIAHEYDKFFDMNDMDADVPDLIQNGLVDLYARIQGSKHINPGYDPQFSAYIYDLVQRRLN